MNADLHANASPRWQTALLCAALALAVYLPAACGASLLRFDDNFFFGPENPEFRDGIGALLDPSRPVANAWLPVAHLSLWLDYAWGKGAPFWPHLHAILLHALAGFVLVRFLLQLGASRAIAHFAGALFLVHPALAESVAWVSGRKDVLSGLFVFTALHQTVLFAKRPAALRALGLAGLAALAMYSKPTAVVLPLLAALVCACVPRSSSSASSRARWWAPAVLLLVTAPIALHHQAIAAAQGTMAGGAWQERLGQVPGAFLHYLATAAWPLHLDVLYPEVQTLERFRQALAAGLAALALVAAVAFAAWRAPAWRLAGFGLASFAIALLPFNTAFPASAIAAADRYLYLALPGFALAVAVAAARAAAWAAGRSAARARESEQAIGARAWSTFAAKFGAAAVAAAFAVLALVRAQAFRDDETLWRASLAQDADNAVAHFDLADALWSRGGAQVGELREHFEAAAKLARYPIHEVKARQALVAIAVAEADYPRAAREAKAAIAAAQAQLAGETTAPRRAEATVVLLRCQLAAFEPLQLAGDEPGADAVYAAAQRLAPEHPDVIAFGAMRELAACRADLLALAAAGKKPVLAEDDPRALAADARLAAALEGHAQHAGLLCARAEWDRARDRVVSALRWYKAAEAVDDEARLRGLPAPYGVIAFLGHARLLRENEEWAAAEEIARKGLRVRSDPALRQELALALVGQGKLDEAQMHLEAYLRVHPDDKDTAKVLSNVLVGRAYSKLGETTDDATEVVKLVERALAYNPNEPRAYLVLGRLAKERRQFAQAVKYLERAHRQMPEFEEARQLYTESLAGLGWDLLLARDEDGAIAAWARCVAVAPADYDVAEIRTQMDRVWARYEAQGVEQLHAGDRTAAAASFRKCLAIEPDQHWAAWLLATALHDAPGADLVEVEKLCRQAIAWQEKHGCEKSSQVLLLAVTLARTGRAADGRALASDYLRAPEADAKPQVLEALRRLAGG
jgi:tetratricopeptide (TPR) repeat protein